MWKNRKRNCVSSKKELWFTSMVRNYLSRGYLWCWLDHGDDKWYRQLPTRLGRYARVLFYNYISHEYASAYLLVHQPIVQNLAEAADAGLITRTIGWWCDRTLVTHVGSWRQYSYMNETRHWLCTSSCLVSLIINPYHYIYTFIQHIKINISCTDCTLRSDSTR